MKKIYGERIASMDQGDKERKSAQTTVLPGLVGNIVGAYVASRRNHIPPAQLPLLIASVGAALQRCQSSAVRQQKQDEPLGRLRSAVNPARSISYHYLICLEDGKAFKSLKRHLARSYNMTPAEYRARWGLPRDYPMVAPAYAKRRSEIARALNARATPTPSS